MAHRSLLTHADKLQALRVVFGARSLRAAAGVLGVTPSALSQSIAALEAHVGRSLAVRTPSGLVPTPWAEHMLGAVGPALDALLSFGEPAAPSLRPVRLRLGAYESLAVSVIPELLARLGIRQPGFRMSVRTGRSGQLAELVRRGDLDAALIAGSEAHGRLEVEKLTTDRLGVWIAPSDPRSREPLSASTPYAGLSTGADGAAPYYARFLRAAGLSRRPMVECDSFEALRTMAIRGVAPAVLPRRVALRTAGELRAMTVGARAEEAGEHAICFVWWKIDRDDARLAIAAELRSILRASA